MNALLDNGSTKTHVNSDMAAELSLKGTLEYTSFFWCFELKK